MKTDLPGTHPTRARASSMLNDLVRDARHGYPSDDALERMSKGLVTSGVFASAANTSLDRAGTASKFAYLKIGAALFVLAGGWFASRSIETSSVSAAANGPAPTSLQTSPSLPTVATASADTIAAEPSSAATVSVDALPTATPSPPRARGSVGTHSSPSAPARGVATRSDTGPSVTSAPAPIARADVPPPVAELELVQRAQAAVAADPQRALAITNEQARLYPDGDYVQEREVFAVEALSRLGQKDEAWQRAAALVQRFPRTPHAARLELATGRRLFHPATPSSASAGVISP